MYHEPGLPNITGDFKVGSDMQHDGFVDGSGAFYAGNSMGSPYTAQGAQTRNMPMIAFDSSRCSSIYGNSNTVQPKSIELSFYIKF